MAHLRDLAMSLADIAFLLGFADQSAFTRAFRRWTDDTPSAFRVGLSDSGLRAGARESQR
jgi:AraC-like DNA-binding protein